MKRALLLGAALALASVACRPWDTELALRLNALDAGDTAAGDTDAGVDGGENGLDAGVDAGPPCLLELCLVDQVAFGTSTVDYEFDVALSSSINDVVVLGWDAIARVDAGQWETAFQPPFVAHGNLLGEGRPGDAWVMDGTFVYHLGSGAPTPFSTCGGVAVQWQNVAQVPDGGALASLKNGAACRFPPSGQGKLLQVLPADSGVTLASLVATATGAYFGADDGNIYDEAGGAQTLGPHLGSAITALGGGPGIGYWAGTNSGEVLALDAGVWGVVWVDTLHAPVARLVALGLDDVWATTGSAVHMGTDHLWADYSLDGFFGNLYNFSGNAEHLVVVGSTRNPSTGNYDAIASRYRRGAVIR